MNAYIFKEYNCFGYKKSLIQNECMRLLNLNMCTYQEASSTDSAKSVSLLLFTSTKPPEIA